MENEKVCINKRLAILLPVSLLLLVVVLFSNYINGQRLSTNSRAYEVGQGQDKADQIAIDRTRAKVESIAKAKADAKEANDAAKEAAKAKAAAAKEDTAAPSAQDVQTEDEINAAKREADSSDKKKKVAAAKPCTIQGIKQISNGPGSRILVNGKYISTNPFFATVPGDRSYTVSLTDYTGGLVYSTYCSNTTTCHGFQDKSRQEGMISKNIYCKAGGYADVWFASRTPNCLDLTGPTTLSVGQVGDYSAKFTSVEGQLGGEIFFENFQSIKALGGFNTEGVINGQWTPTKAGVYTVGCRAWNDGIAECRPAHLVDLDPGNQFPCGGTDGAGAKTTIIVTVTE